MTRSSFVRWRFLTVCACIAMISQALRASITVLAPDLMVDVGFGPEVLGILTGIFFFTHGGTQIPWGIALDVAGARRSMLFALSLAAAGSTVFAIADGITMLFAGRFLMGLGCGPLFMAAFVMFSRWFPPDIYARRISVVISLSHLGTLFATAPLAAIMVWVGWRGAFWGFGLAICLAMVLVVLYVRDAPPDAPPLEPAPRESLAEILIGVGRVFSQRQVRRILPLTLAAYPGVAVIALAWGGKYLYDVHGLDVVARGNVLLTMSIMSMLAPLGWGWLDSIIGSRRTVLLGACGECVVLAVLAVVPEPGLYVAAGLMIALGCFSGFGLLLPATVRNLFPESMTGRAMTAINVGVISGVALWQILSGFVVGGFVDGAGTIAESGYRTLFAVLAVNVAIGTFSFSRAGELPRSRPAGL